MSLTRGDVKQLVGQQLKEFQGTPAGDDPFLYNRIIQDVVDDVARDTFCLYTTRTTSLVANQAVYCIPELMRLKCARVLDVAGNWQKLLVMESWKADDRYGTTWRNDTAGDPPSRLFYTAINSSFTLDPPPSVARANALALEGYFVPGSVWAYDSSGNPVVITDTSAIPLPTEAENAVLLGVKARRADEFGHPKADKYEKDYILAKRRLEGIVRTAFPRDHRLASGG